MKTVEPIQTVALVGASGEMGGVFSSLAEKAGCAVNPLGRPLTHGRLEAAIEKAELVMLSVPIPTMEEVLERVVPHMRPGQILADACSVKSRPLELMLRAWDGPVAGTHPLFGGVLPEQSDRRVAVVEGRGAEAARAVSDWMERLGFVPFATTAREHDDCMAYIQSLNFVTSVSYLSCMAKHPEISNFLTPSFKRRLTASKKMLLRDSDLFEIIFETNPASQEAVRRFSSHLSIAAGGDVNLLVERAKWWWSKEAGLNGDVK